MYDQWFPPDWSYKCCVKFSPSNSSNLPSAGPFPYFNLILAGPARTQTVIDLTVTYSFAARYSWFSTAWSALSTTQTVLHCCVVHRLQLIDISIASSWVYSTAESVPDLGAWRIICTALRRLVAARCTHRPNCATNCAECITTYRSLHGSRTSSTLLYRQHETTTQTLLHCMF